MKQKIAIAIDTEILKLIKENAKKQNRSISNYVEQTFKTKVFHIKEEKL